MIAAFIVVVALVLALAHSHLPGALRGLLISEILSGAPQARSRRTSSYLRSAPGFRWRGEPKADNAGRYFCKRFISFLRKHSAAWSFTRPDRLHEGVADRGTDESGNPRFFNSRLIASACGLVARRLRVQARVVSVLAAAEVPQKRGRTRRAPFCSSRKARAFEIVAAILSRLRMMPASFISFSCLAGFVARDLASRRSGRRRDGSLHAAAGWSASSGRPAHPPRISISKSCAVVVHRHAPTRSS